eukprot:Awhi_evm1s1635
MFLYLGGAFGAVHKGAIFYQGKAAICAIKTLNEPETGKQEFMDEAVSDGYGYGYGLLLLLAYQRSLI